jgi:hypothetical protein
VAHAFYLLAEGLSGAVGLQDAAEIFHRAQTLHLVSNSQFIDARFACISSAEELFGVNSPQALKTAEAFDAVGIFDDEPTPEPPPVEPVSAPDSALFICYEKGGLYLDRYEGGTEYYLSGTEVSPSRASVAGNGSIALFVDSLNDLCYTLTDCSYCEECFDMQGQVHSVAMSTDGQLFGIVLLDEYGDPYDEIGIIDFQEDPEGEIGIYPLVSPAIDGVSIDTIQYADVMDFTSDNRYIIYDAFNVFQFQTATEVGTWSIYAIDLQTEQTIALTTPNADYEVGNPALSQTTNNMITFDVMDTATGHSTVYAANLFTAEVAAVGTVPNSWGVPGYNGDDTAIVYSYPDSSPTGFYLRQQPLGLDLMTPQGSPSKAFDLISGGAFGVVFRRGAYTSPEQNITVSPDTMSFGEVSLGSSSTASVTISNIGTANLKIEDYYLTGADSSEFDIVSGTCIGSNLVPTGACMVTVAFLPTSQGEKTATLSIESDDPDTPVFEVQIYGEGIVSNVWPNLIPYQPNGWSDKIVASVTTGDHTDASVIYDIDEIYVDWAVINNGNASADQFYTALYVDDVLINYWNTFGLMANYYAYITDYSIGTLWPGAHTIKVSADYTGLVTESSEVDNIYTRTINVSASGYLTMYYRDSDNDGYGNPNDSLYASSQPEGFVLDNTDNCPRTYNPDQEDSDGDGCGDACDARPDDPKWVTIAGFISLADETPVVAMMLANGQHIYSNNPIGEYNLDVPLNPDGEITLYAFCGGQAPFKTTLTPSEALCYEIIMEASSPNSKEMNVTAELEESTLKSGWVHISGQVTTEDESPFVAMVLANGQKQFSNNPVGEYSLHVPLNPDNEITLYVFGGGQAPFKTILPFD